MEKGKGASPMRRLDWAVAATSGTFMVGAVIAGLLIGTWLDKRFGIDPIGKAIGVILGGVAGHSGVSPHAVASLPTLRDDAVGSAHDADSMVWM
jgi:F0F1-type ATP synthase assembly protein I